jgi:predicted component of type VI protein secretion system
MNAKVTYLHKEMVEEWESWEHLIREDVERLESRLQSVHQQMSVQKIPPHIREPFITAKLKMIIKEVCVGD